MNEDPVYTQQGWPESSATGAPAAESSAARVAFCQDCGKPLTAETVRTVGAGIFCEPCLAVRIGAANPAGYPSTPPIGSVPVELLPVDTHPVLAGFLGLIPGVGAMYNGQYSKGFAHLVIFVVLDALEKNVNNVFGVFVLGWIGYQVFDAYHTAKARSEGLPLPNVFGLNDIGERMGFVRNTHATGTPKPPPPAWQTPPAASPVPPTSGPDWVGYVPPTHFTSAAPDPGTSTYAETYTGTTQSAPYVSYVSPIAPTVATSPTRRFPVGAIWLIALGALILLANLLPDWRLTGRWFAPVLLAGLSVWLFVRRLRSGTPIVCILRWPAVLMVLAITSAMHAAYYDINAGITFALLFIVFGALLLLERTVGASSSHPYVPPAPTSFVPPVRPDVVDDDTTKGGL